MSLPIARLLTRTVTYSVRTAVDNYGDPTFGSQTAIAAYVESDNDTVIGTNGEEIRSTHKIVTATEIPKDARIWLPGDSTADTDKVRRVLSTRTAQNPGGFTVYETWV